MSDTDKTYTPDDPRNPENLNKPLKERVADLVAIHGCPLDELFRIGMDLEEEPSTRLSALKEAASYAYAKRKAIEISGPEGQPLETKIDLSKLSDKELAAFQKLAEKASI
jgi:hypothetical protein